MSEKEHGLKSAYELALERMGSGSDVSLSEEQKEEIARIERDVSAKVAEIEIMSGQRLAEARGKGDFEEVEDLQEKKRIDIRRVTDAAEADKMRIRKS